jgi:hypothetical protein
VETLCGCREGGVQTKEKYNLKLRTLRHEVWKPEYAIDTTAIAKKRLGKRLSAAMN